MEEETFSTDLSKIELSQFQPHLESTFTVKSLDDDLTTELILKEASEYPDHRPEDQQTDRKPFSLVFACAEQVIPQGLYRLEHDSLDAIEAFFSPFAPHEKGCMVEVVFN